MNSEKTQRVAYMKGFDAGYRKFEAEFETLLEVSEGRLREIDTLKAALSKTLNEVIHAQGGINKTEYAEFRELASKKKPHSRIDIVGQNGNSGEHYE